MTLRVRSISLLVLLYFLFGCSGKFPAPDQHANDAAAPESVVVEGELRQKSPIELFQYVAAAAADFDDTERVFNVSGGQFRMQTMRRRLVEELTGYQVIETHNDATQDERSKAILGQIDALSKGIEHGWTGYNDKLVALRDRLLKERPHSIEAATVDAVYIYRTHLISIDDPQEVTTALEQHAKSFPNQPTGARLFAIVAQQLLEANQVEQAKRVCLQAAKLYTDVSLLEPLDQVARQIRNREIAQQQRRALLQTRSKEFGGHFDGYFVLFLRPKKLRYMSRVDYVVAHGLEDAIQAVDASDAWELKGWFPDTKSGYEQATQLADELLKKNTVSMPDFSSE